MYTWIGLPGSPLHLWLKEVFRAIDVCGDFIELHTAARHWHLKYDMY